MQQLSKVHSTGPSEYLTSPPAATSQKARERPSPQFCSEQFAKLSFIVTSTTGSQKWRIANGVCPVRFSHCSRLISSSCSAADINSDIPRAMAKFIGSAKHRRTQESIAEMKRRRKSVRMKAAAPSTRLQKDKLVIPANLLCCARRLKQMNQIRATSQQHMLAVHNLMQRRMLIRRRSPANIRPPLQQSNIVPGASQRAGGRQARNPRAHNCNRRCYVFAHGPISIELAARFSSGKSSATTKSAQNTPTQNRDLFITRHAHTPGENVVTRTLNLKQQPMIDRD